MSQVMDKPVTREQHTIALARLHTQPGWNVRTERNNDKYTQLVASVKRTGVLQPILVAPHPDIEGEYVITAGEGRYLAACDASLTEIPCVLDVPDPETGGLDNALIENMIRDDLSPLDEARGFERLRESGLSLRGIAERLCRTPKFVRERLQLLVLPEQVQREIDNGAIPLAAAAPLAKLAEMHAELPMIAVQKVMKKPDKPYLSYYQPTWADLIDDPVGVALAEGYTIELPTDVYVGGGEFALDRFTLSGKAERDLGKLLEIAVPAVREDIRVTWGRDLVAQAAALKAAYVAANGAVLIIGQDVADQLAGDAIARMLREARQREQEALVRLREQAVARAGGQKDAGADPQVAKDAKAAAQREQDKTNRRKAIAHNEALGTAVLTAMPKVKVDVRVLKILAAIEFGAELCDIAARGARYCLPFDAWKQHRKLDSGVVKIELAEARDCTAPAQSWLEGARGQADYAGRLLTLAVLARYADERALANGRRAHYELRPGSDLPWSDEVLDLIDEIASEFLPEHLTAHILEPKRAERRKVEEARALLDRALADPSALTANEWGDAHDAVYTVHGYTDTARELRAQLREARNQCEDKTAPDENADEQADTAEQALAA